MIEDHRVRVPPELFQWLAARARRHDRSVNGEVRSILRALQQFEAEPEPAKKGPRRR
jgi:plasmid stability protein